MGRVILSGLQRLIERAVFPVPSSGTLFNPYSSDHPAADRPGAFRIRRANLRNFLTSYAEPPRVLIVGEASGPWGCRFSGVPFTSEKQLTSGMLPFSGRQSSTATEPCRERTADIFWDVMARYHPQCFIWNAVPLHPHFAGEPFSLRRPCPAEVKAFSDLLSAIIAMLKPRCTVAVGRIAERALQSIDVVPVYVRHPSHGGNKEFKTGIERILDRNYL